MAHMRSHPGRWMIRSCLLAVLLAAGCSPYASYRFTGTDVHYRQGMIQGRKDLDRILIVNNAYKFGIRLPYAEDWVFQPSPGKPLYASSRQLQMAASVMAGRIETRPFDEAAYLGEELKRIEQICLDLGGKVTRSKVIDFEGRRVLTYRTRLETPSGAVEQEHFWGVQQEATGERFDIHLSTLHLEKEKLQEVAVVAVLIILNEFRYLP